MFLPIVVYGHPILRKISEDITPEYPELEKFIRDLFQTMDEADMIAFLQAIEGDAYEIELCVDAFTGLRQGELLGLTWDCVDFEHQTLLINKQHNRAKGEKEFHFSSLKTEKVRSLTVTDEVVEALRRQQRRQAAWKAAAGELWSNLDNLVVTTEFGRYVNNKTLYMNF